MSSSRSPRERASLDDGSVVCRRATATKVSAAASVPPAGAGVRVPGCTAASERVLLDANSRVELHAHGTLEAGDAMAAPRAEARRHVMPANSLHDALGRRRGDARAALVGALAATLLPGLACREAGPRRATPIFEVGAAAVRITPEVGPDSPPVWIAGYGNGRRATGVNDDLYARALIVEGQGGRLALVAVDVIGLFLESVQRAGKIVEALGLGLRTEDLIVASTHNHEGPDTMGLWGPSAAETGLDLAYLRFVEKRISEAVREAASEMRPAILRFGETEVPEDLNCDGRLPHVVDRRLLVMEAAEPGSGRPIATLVGFASHPEILGRGNTLLTADYPGFLLRALERERGGVGVFVAGAVGGLLHPRCVLMDDPRTGKPASRDSFRNAELYGEELARLALDALRGASPSARADLWVARREVTIPLANARFQTGLASGVIGAGELEGRFRPGPAGEWTFTTEVGLARIGDGLFLLVPGEIYPELVLGGVPDPAESGADFPDAPPEPALLPRMQGPFNFVVGLANDEIGYLIPRRQWDVVAPFAYGRAEPQYGEVNSVGPFAATRVSAALHALLEQTRGGTAPIPAPTRGGLGPF